MRKPATRTALLLLRGAAAVAVLLTTLLTTTVSWAQMGIPITPAPEGAAVYIISPADGATVSSPVTIQFGLRGMGVTTSGHLTPKAGHHHLLLDTTVPGPGAPIPADDNHRHFGGGQTEVTLELSAGQHTLQLILGDHIHVPHGPPIVSEQITITVK